MANQKISTLPPAAALTGVELIETVQAGVSSKTTVDSINQATPPRYVTAALAAGTHTDNVLPGVYDYILDYDTTAGPIELDGFVAQRDGQRLTITATGPNQLKLGNNVGAAGNRLRSSAPISLLQNDGATIQYCQAITQWVQA